MPQYGYVRPAKSRKWLWFVAGAVVIVIALAVASVMVLARYRELEETARVNHMVSIAEGIPSGPGWEVTASEDPKYDPGCFPLENPCHELERTWQTPGSVELDELRTSTGYQLKTFTYPDCGSSVVEQIYHVELCVRPGQVVLRMYDSW